MKIPALQSLFNKVKEKETSTQVFSCEYCEIFKNTNFEDYLRTAASVLPRFHDLTNISYMLRVYFKEIYIF